MSTDHTARPESWARITEQAGWGDPYADLILEFSARVERLEQAQQQGNSSAILTSSPPAPSTPAGQGELVRSVAQELCPNSLHDWTPMASRAILAVAHWLVGKGYVHAADMLRREVGR
jgi:hypothetical protein